MSFIKTVSHNKIGATSGMIPESRRQSIYKKDGLVSMNVIEIADGEVTRSMYIDTNKRQENMNFWASPEGVALSEKFKDIVLVISRERVEELPDVSEYAFVSIDYTLIERVPAILEIVSDIDAITLVEFWDTANFRLGFTKAKKDAVTKVLNTLKVKFAAVA